MFGENKTILPGTNGFPKNFGRLRKAIFKSRKRSARKHVAVLTVSGCTLGQILHEDPKFHSHKLPAVQKLNPRDFVLL